MDWFQEGIEDAFNFLEAKPDPLHYDMYMAGYSTGKELMTKAWLASYNKGRADGLDNNEPSSKKGSYIRGYTNGQLERIANAETDQDELSGDLPEGSESFTDAE